MSQSNHNEKKHFPNKRQQDIIDFPREFRNEFLSVQDKEALGIPMISIRIIFKIVNNCKYDQFQNEPQPHQLALFEEEFKTEHNTYARFTFKQSEIDSSRNVKAMENGLIWLKRYKEGIYKSKNAKGKWIKSHGGFVKDFTMSEGNVSLLIPSYWLEKLINITGGFNKTIYTVAWHFRNSKHFLFFLWILNLKNPGTRKKIKDIQLAYYLNYSSIKDFAKFFLKPIKEKLDQVSNVTFNYSIDGDCVNIKKIKQVPPGLDSEVYLSSQTINKLQLTKKLSYWNDRHKLSEYQYDLIKRVARENEANFMILENAYKLLVRDFRKKKVKIVTLLGEEFLEEFQKAIKEYYKKTAFYALSPNDYPIILK